MPYSGMFEALKSPYIYGNSFISLQPSAEALQEVHIRPTGMHHFTG